MKEWKAGLTGVAYSDFECPNHYAKLVAKLAQAEIIDRLLSLLPPSVDK